MASPAWLKHGAGLGFCPLLVAVYLDASRDIAGLGCSMALAQGVYEVPWHVILDSAARALTAWDLITSMIKAWVFGTIIAVVRGTLC